MRPANQHFTINHKAKPYTEHDVAKRNRDSADMGQALKRRAVEEHQRKKAMRDEIDLGWFDV